MTTYAISWEADMPTELGGGRDQVVAERAHARVVRELQDQHDRLLDSCQTLVEALQDAWWVQAADALAHLDRECAARRRTAAERLEDVIATERDERKGSPASEEGDDR